MKPMQRSRGFVLLSVLIFLSVASSAALLMSARARDAIAAIQNRTSSEGLQWQARGCLAEARSAIDGALNQRSEGEARDQVWRNLDALFERDASHLSSDCVLLVEPFGTRANVNFLDSLELERLFAEELGRVSSEATASVLDWRDGDTVARAAGAEHAWYVRHERYGPRDGPLATDDEILMVRALADYPQAAALLTVETDLVLLSHAPRAVVAAVAGDDPLVLALLLSSRTAAGTKSDLRDVLVSPDTAIARRAASQYNALSSRLTLSPAAWRLTVRAMDPAGRLQVTVEQRVQRTLSSAFVVWERSR